MSARSRLRRASADEGSITLWLLGVCVMLLFLGGLSLDLWRAFGERRQLAGIADAAAAAGASGIDTDVFRTTGEVQLDPALARRLANDSIASQQAPAALTGAFTSATPERVSVELRGQVDLTLMRVLVPLESSSLPIQVRASAEPIRAP